jgi:hypothetical protein
VADDAARGDMARRTTTLHEGGVPIGCEFHYPAAVFELLETCWRVREPSGRVVTCAMYRVPFGLELRVLYSDDDVLKSQLYVALGAAERDDLSPELHRRARAEAEAWRESVLSPGGFEDLDGDTSGDCG